MMMVDDPQKSQVGAGEAGEAEDRIPSPKEAEAEAVEAAEVHQGIQGIQLEEEEEEGEGAEVVVVVGLLRHPHLAATVVMERWDPVPRLPGQRVACAIVLQVNRGRLSAGHQLMLLN